MTALALIEPGTAIAAASFDDWRALGRSLAHTRITIDFALGDWLNQGREQFAPEQIEMVLGEIASDAEQARQMRRVEKVAKAFPPAIRNTALTFEHHAHLADLPVQEALPLLKEAGDAKMSAKALRTAAMLRKVDLGLVLPREDDPEDDAMLALCRAWNRAPLSVREDFYAMAEEVAETGFGVVEP